MAGALTPIAVPSPSAEAARDLARAREQVRLDLMRCRHRLSKLLLRHGRVWDRTAWTTVHREWLSAQTFAQQNTELAFIDNLAACDGLTARKDALDERLSWVATDPEFWPIVRRLRAFRGIDTLSALIIVLEVLRLHPVSPLGAARIVAGGLVLSEAQIRHGGEVQLRYRGWGTKKEVTPGRRSDRKAKRLATKGRQKSGARGCASRVETASLPPLIARRERGCQARETLL